MNNKNKRPSSVCTLATNESYKDLHIFIYSLRLFEPDIPICVLCDTKIIDLLKYYKKDSNVFFYPELDKYSNKNRLLMEKEEIWTEFMLKKCDIIDISIDKYKDTLFADSDVCFLNSLPSIPNSTSKYNLGGSPHYIKKSDTDKYGYYNGGFLWVGNNTITTAWKKYTKHARFFEQSSIEDIMTEFNSFEFSIQNNFGWWRLFQCEKPQERLHKFSVCSETGNIYYDNQLLRSIHTHLTNDTDINMPYFNNIIIQLLKAGKKNNKNYARLLIYLDLLNKNAIV